MSLSAASTLYARWHSCYPAAARTTCEPLVSILPINGQMFVALPLQSQTASASETKNRCRTAKPWPRFAFPASVLVLRCSKNFRRVSLALGRCSHQSELLLRVSAQFHRSEEHTSELQSHHDLVCRLLLEKKKKTNKSRRIHNSA